MIASFCLFVFFLSKFTYGNKHKNSKQIHRTHKDLCVVDEAGFRKTSLKSYEQSTDKITVDVFTIVSNPKEFLFARSGEFWLNFELMKTYLKPGNSFRLHIFSDIPWIIEQGTEQGYLMYNLDDFKELNEKFMAIYEPNHHSVNTVEYEFLCFNRWHLYRHIVDVWNNNLKATNSLDSTSSQSNATYMDLNRVGKTSPAQAIHLNFLNHTTNHTQISPTSPKTSLNNKHNVTAVNLRKHTHQLINTPITNIITMDSDVIILQDPVEYFVRTLQTLGLYNSQTDDADVNNNGISNSNNSSRSNREQNLNSNSSFDLVVVAPGAMHLWSHTGLIAYSDYIYWWYSRPVEQVLQHTETACGYWRGHLHFSDMQLVEVFIMKNKAKRNGCFIRVTIQGNDNKNRATSDTAMVNAIGCLSLAKYDDMQLVVTDNKFLDKDTKLPYCFMHFQGPAKKPFMKIFARFLLSTLGVSPDNYNGFMRKVISEQIFVKSRHQQDIYLLSFNGSSNSNSNSNSNRSININSSRSSIYSNSSINSKLRIPDWDTFVVMLGAPPKKGDIPFLLVPNEVLEIFPLGEPVKSLCTDCV